MIANKDVSIKHTKPTSDTPYYGVSAYIHIMSLCEQIPPEKYEASKAASEARGIAYVREYLYGDLVKELNKIKDLIVTCGSSSLSPLYLATKRLEHLIEKIQ